MLTGKIILIGRWLRCHSQMFTVWMTSIGKWLKMSQLVECGSFKQMILFFTLWCPCIAAMSPKSSANWKWQFVSTGVVSVSTENAKMLAHSLQQLLAEQVRIFSHSLQSRRLRLTKWWLMAYKSWQPATIALIQIDLSGIPICNNASRFAGRKRSLNGQ